MPKIITEPTVEPRTPGGEERPAISDHDFLRTAGIVPELGPRASLAVKIALAAGILLAGTTSVFAGMFTTSAPAGSPAYTACSTSCPGMARSVLP